jgi:type IV pilus assembly protein PilA
MRHRLPFPHKATAAFTLIELLVVVVILGILMAVAVPTFLRQQTKAQDSRTQQYLTTAFKAIRSGTVDTNDQYPSSTSMVSWIQQSEPELTVSRGGCYTGTATAPTDAVLVDPSSGANSLLLCSRSASGNVWELSATATGAPTLIDGTLVPLTFSGNEITDATRAADVQGDGLSNDSSTGVWEPTTNLVPNGGFESGVSGWVAANSTFTSDSTISKFGLKSGKLTSTGNGQSSAQIFNLVSNPVQGTAYSLSLWVYASGSSVGKTFRVQVNEAGGAHATQATAQQDYTLKSGWQYLTATGSVVQSDRTSLYILPQIFNSVTGDIVYLDGVQLEQKSGATPYVETNGTTATRAGAQVQAPSGLLTSTSTLWFAARVVIDSTDDATNHYIAYLSVPGGNSIYLYRGQGGPNRVWEMQQSSGQGIGWPDNTNPAGTAHTLIGYVTPTQVGVSLDGGVFKTAARTSGTGLTPSALYVGSSSSAASQQLDGRILWLACGTGTLSSADAATINSIGNADPTRANFPSSAQVTMTWDGTSATGSLK